MTAEASPRPWRVEESIGGWKACVSDANGNPVASCWGGGPTEQQEKAETIAALIVNAVNIYDHQFDRYVQALCAERDRLRNALDEIHHKASVALGCPRREEEAVALLVHDLLGIKECARAALGEKKK